MSEAPTQDPAPAIQPQEERALGVTEVTEEELAHLDFSSWKADQWLEDAVELEMRFGITPDAGTAEPGPEPRPFLYRVMEWLLVVNVTLVVVLFLLYGLGEDAAENTPSGGPPWREAFRAAQQAQPHRAVELLEQYLAANPSLPDVERALTYNLLAFYLVRDGRFEEAGRYERKSHAIAQRAAGRARQQWAPRAGERNARSRPR